MIAAGCPDPGTVGTERGLQSLRAGQAESFDSAFLVKKEKEFEACQNTNYLPPWGLALKAS